MVFLRLYIKIPFALPQLSAVTESSQNTTVTTAPPTVLGDDQTLAPMPITQQAAHVAIQQLQQGHGITLTSDQDGQQIYVVADPSQLEALQVSFLETILEHQNIKAVRIKMTSNFNNNNNINKVSRSNFSRYFAA